jgi:hypothetical protein
MKQSNYLSLNGRDLLHTFILVIISSVLYFLQETFIPALNISPELKAVLVYGIAYLSKKFFEKPALPSTFADGNGAGTPETGL